MRTLQPWPVRKGPRPLRCNCDSATYDALHNLAGTRGKTVGELVRVAVARYLATETNRAREAKCARTRKLHRLPLLDGPACRECKYYKRVWPIESSQQCAPMRRAKH